MSDSDEKYLRLINQYAEIQNKNKSILISDDKKKELNNLIDSGELFKEIGLSVDCDAKDTNKRTKKRANLTMCYNVETLTINPIENVLYAKETQTNEINHNNYEDSPLLGRVVSPKFITALEWDDEFDVKFHRQSSNNDYEPQKNKNVPKNLTDQDKVDILNSNDFLDFFDRATEMVEECLEDNVDIFTDYSGNFEDEINTTNSRKILDLSLTLSDESKWTRQRPVTSLEWSPHSSNDTILASYFSSCTDQVTLEPDGVCLVWNITSNEPQTILHYQSPITVAKYSQYHPSLIIGGSYSGQIVIWDTRTNKRTPAQRTLLSANSHTHPIVSISPPSPDGTSSNDELCSLSSDGKMCSWRIEMLNQPIDSCQLTNNKSKEVYSTCMELLRPTNQSIGSSGEGALCSNRFIVGAEDGNMYLSSRSGGHSGECTRLLDAPVPNSDDFSTSSNQSPSHAGPVLSVSVLSESRLLQQNSRYFSNPSTSMMTKSFSVNNNVDMTTSFYNQANNGGITNQHDVNFNVFLSSSVDYTVKLWSDIMTDGVPGLIFTLEDQRSDYVYDIEWSPMHPGVFSTVDGAGRLDIWNLLSTFEEPIAKETTDSQSAINRCRWHKSGSTIATGDDSGRIRIYSVNELSAHQPKHSEWSDLGSLLRYLHNESLNQVPSLYSRGTYGELGGIV